MKLSKFSYSFAQARKNMVRNGLMSVASLFTTASCLIILGLFTILTFNVNYNAARIKDKCEIQLYMKQDITEERISEIGDEILNVPNVKEVLLFSKEDLLDYAMKDMFQGKEELVSDFTDDNPFSDSYKITLDDIEKTGETVTALEQLADVDHIENKQDVVNLVVSLSKAVKKVSVGVMALLLLIAIVIISNTIKMTVFNRKKEIGIMKYIGATDRFIRVPFILEGIIIGILGAVVSFGLVSWGYVVLASFAEGSEFSAFQLLPYTGLAPVIGGIFIVIGCLIGMLGSAISMRKYLNV